MFLHTQYANHSQIITFVIKSQVLLKCLYQLTMLAKHHEFALEDLQRNVWISQIQRLKKLRQGLRLTFDKTYRLNFGGSMLNYGNK